MENNFSEGLLALLTVSQLLIFSSAVIDNTCAEVAITSVWNNTP